MVCVVSPDESPTVAEVVVPATLLKITFCVESATGTEKVTPFGSVVVAVTDMLALS